MDAGDDLERAWRLILQHDHAVSDDEATQLVQRYIDDFGSLPEPATQAGGFEVLGTFHLPRTSRLTRAACCPDKDLIAVVLKRGSKDRLGLWDLQGVRKWEVQVDLAIAEPEHISSVAWSPDGKYLLVAHYPPRFSIHDIHDGAILQSIASASPVAGSEILDLWWLSADAKPSDDTPFPDLLRRWNKTPGSAFSVLAMLPTLDRLQGQPSAQSAETRAGLLNDWPSLLPFHHFPQAADLRINDTQRPKDAPAPVFLRDNVAYAIDQLGQIHVFLAGTYYLGFVKADIGFSPSLCKVPHSPIILLHRDFKSQLLNDSELVPSSLYIPSIVREEVHHIAQISSSLRDLFSYCASVIDEMHKAWYGPDTATAPRSMGKKWLEAFENIQITDWGYLEGRGLLELYTLLAVGHPSQALAAALSGGENMSDRKLTKWENSVSDALTRIATYAERRLHPACQRAHLLLEELIAIFQTQELLPPSSLLHTARSCSVLVGELLRKTALLLYLGTGLAIKARDELNKFKEFVGWLRYETQRAQNSTNDVPTTLAPKHDPSEVNRYLTSGLVASEVDGWFEGSEPDDETLAVFQGTRPSARLLSRTIDDLETILGRVEDLPEGAPGFRPSNKNVQALTESLLHGCVRLFQDCARSVTESATIKSPESRIPPSPGRSNVKYAEWTTWGEDGTTFVESLAAYIPGSPNHLAIIRTHFEFSDLRSEARSFEVAVHACVPRFMDPAFHAFEILELQFLDDETLVIAIRHSLRDRKQGSSPFVATVAYGGDSVEYETWPAGVKGHLLSTREGAIAEVTQRLQAGGGQVREAPVERMHELTNLSKTGKVRLVLNGKRRVGCVMDERARVEVVDLSSEGIDMLGKDREMEE